LWLYAGLNFGEHNRFEVVWQAAAQITKLGYTHVVVASVCVKGLDQVIKKCRHEASIGHSIYKRKLIFAPCLKPTSLKK
jgi:hypothetical protein